MTSAAESAEARFRQALARLKNGTPVVLPKGTPVSQNNVAKEAGRDPTALKKDRYPALVREIKGYVEIADHEKTAQSERKARQKQQRVDLATKVELYQKQRDTAQSLLLSAQHRLIELLHENAALSARLEDLAPRPTKLRD